ALEHRGHGSAGNDACRSEPVILQIAEGAQRGNPNASAIILKKRVRIKSIQFSVRFATSGARNRDLPVLPSVQAATSGKPDASIPGRQDRSYDGARQTLVHSQRSDRKVAEAVEATRRRYPNTAFTILKERVDIFA